MLHLLFGIGLFDPNAQQKPIHCLHTVTLSLQVVYLPEHGLGNNALTPCCLQQVGRVYPQAVYFPIRTLYLTLKIEQRERYKSGTFWLGWLNQWGTLDHSCCRRIPAHSSPSTRGQSFQSGPEDQAYQLRRVCGSSCAVG